jgi:hypothetical protein
MGRKNRRSVAPTREYIPRTRVETHPDGEWYVRSFTGSSATKDYRCPGCDQVIRPATPHIVAWSADDPQGAEFRRHWHTSCWSARDRRRPR